MRFAAPIGLPILLIAVSFSAPALAQVTDDCMRQAIEACANDPVVECMSRDGMFDMVGQECIGDLQTMIEMDREARQEQQSDRQEQNRKDTDQQAATTSGMSLGGVLRSGPGMEYGKVASMKDGDPIEIVEDTGVWFNGYKWYRVSTRKGDGYHWGGIFCVNLDTQITGIFDKCN